MKKLYSLSLVLLMCSCSRGGSSPSGSNTTFYNPDISYQQIIDAVEISEGEFKAEVDAHYIEPKSRYEHMKCILTSDTEFDIYGGMIFNSLNVYFSLLNTLPNPNDESTLRLFSARVDFEGSLFGAQADIMYWRPIFYMLDIYDMVRESDGCRFFKTPYSIEYGSSETEIVRIVYDDNFLPVQVERKTPTNERIHMWHYDFAYFSPKDVKVGRGEVSKEAYAERYMKLCNNKISYTSYSMTVKGKRYVNTSFDPYTAQYIEKIEDIDVTLTGQIKINNYFYEDTPKILSYIRLDTPSNLSRDDDIYLFLYVSDFATSMATLSIVPKYHSSIFKYFDSPLRAEGYRYTQQDDGSWKMESEWKWYFEYNDEGLIKKYTNRGVSPNGVKCDLEFTISYK